MSVAGKIAGLITAMGSGPVFAHSDPFRVARLVKPVRDRAAYLDSHISLMKEATDGRALWLPTFNYEFPKSRVYDVRESVSQLGPLPEHFRTTAADWRTPIPIFSIAGGGPTPNADWGVETDPFGEDSIFAELVREDGVVLYYGDTFHYNTLVHYSERVAGGPVYRYDKLFTGTVVYPDGSAMQGSLNYHVRPMGTGLDYDWARLLADALDEGVCRRLEEHPEILAASARQLSDLWVNAMKADPLSLLDENTRSWAEPRAQQLGRRFTIDDFEGPISSGSAA